jgi:hypothetical protein
MVTTVDIEISLSCGRVSIEYEDLTDAALEKIRPNVERMLEEEGTEYFETDDGKNAVDVEVRLCMNL